VELCVVGTGYVGLVAGACLADLGHHVVAVDSDPRKLARLEAGECPIHEPGLPDVLHRVRAHGRLVFTQDLKSALARSAVVFIAVGTPSADDGSADLRSVEAVFDEAVGLLTHPTTVIVKSTVPPGTADALRARAAGRTDQLVDVVSNPEFLAEGTAVDDFTRPDRIVIGAKTDAAHATMDRIYAPLVRTGRPLLHMDNRSAELAKYAANAMLAARVTMMNELANLSDALGADIEMVRRVVGSDQRLGARYLFPGCGYGGSCFPKDIQALMHLGRALDVPTQLTEAVHDVNERQKALLARKLSELVGPDWSGRHLAVWGLAFKSRTDDVRDAPSLVFIAEALRRGATVTAYDPEAIAQTRAILGGAIAYATDSLACLDGADALVIPTDWNEFRSPDFAEMGRRLRGRNIVDGRNLFDPQEVANAGFRYRCIGRPEFRTP
jgi:UDPglucose 6-dehydrogenase